MTEFDVDFLGCKISHTDAQAIREALASAGHVEDRASARLAVVNACCITSEAEGKSRKRVRQMLDAGSERVFVTGCGANLNPAQYELIDSRVTVLGGAASLAAHTIVEQADHLAALGCRGGIDGERPQSGRPRHRTRAFVKVEDGCDFDCTYCIVPTVRGRSRSRRLAAVLDDVRRHVARGQHEIVLTGINIGQFREPELRWGLPRLLRATADVAGVERVRISSIEINHVDKRLVAVMAEHPKICPHLHVPMQSGSAQTLRAMGRHYRPETYVRAIARAREAMPDLNVTTDVIVGFPGESDADFAATLALCERVNITKAHVFPFSARPGTAVVDDRASREPVDEATKRQRSRALRAACAERARRHRLARVGQFDEVLVEARGRSGRRAGYLRDYTPVAGFVDAAGSELSASDDLVTGTCCAVEIAGVRDDGVEVRALSRV